MKSSKQESEIIALENKFWQAVVDDDNAAAMKLLHEPALMVYAQGAMAFDRSEYAKMAEQSDYSIVGFEISDEKVIFAGNDVAVISYRVVQTKAPSKHGDKQTTETMNDSSTWVRDARGWTCVLHTETPASGKPT